MTSTPPLTFAQHGRLDRIAEEDPGAVVVALDDGSPVVVRSDCRRQQILPTGRIRPRGKAPAQVQRRRIERETRSSALVDRVEVFIAAGRGL